jgi:hypothetical protein
MTYQLLHYLHQTERRIPLIHFFKIYHPHRYDNATRILVK